MHKIIKCCKICCIPLGGCLFCVSPIYCGWDKFHIDFESTDTVQEKILKMFGIMGFKEYNTFYGPPEFPVWTYRDVAATN